MLLEQLSSEAKKAKTIILYDDPPGINESRFLLREQLIGEQRGLERALDIVLVKREQLITEESKKTDNETAIEPDDD
jgi:hypothetical protein